MKCPKCDARIGHAHDCPHYAEQFAAPAQTVRACKSCGGNPNTCGCVAAPIDPTPSLNRCLECEKLFQKWYRSFMAQFKRTGNIIDKLPHEFCAKHAEPAESPAAFHKTWPNCPTCGKDLRPAESMEQARDRFMDKHPFCNTSDEHTLALDAWNACLQYLKGKGE